MHAIQIEFENYVQAQEYDKADSLIQSLLCSKQIKDLSRKEALQLLYRIGYVYPKLTLSICKQRSDIPKPFIDTLNIALGNIPPLRLYEKADALVAIKIALMRNKPLLAKILIRRFYRQFDLTPISLVKNSRLKIGNNHVKLVKKPNDSKVSIVVTTFNSERFIDNCLKSLLNQTLDNMEIIVVDDASTDNTIKIVKTYPNIELINLNKNKGTYFARNVGVKHATGKFITFQDSDDWSHPERLEKQLLNLTKNPTILANFSKFFRVHEGSGLPSCRQNYPLLRLNLSSLMMYRKTFEDLGGFNDRRRIESDKILLKNITSKYSKSAVKYIDLPLAIGLLRSGSLTTSKKSGFNKYGFSETRELIY